MIKFKSVFAEAFDDFVEKTFTGPIGNKHKMLRVVLEYIKVKNTVYPQKNTDDHDFADRILGVCIMKITGGAVLKHVKTDINTKFDYNKNNRRINHTWRPT